MAIRYRDLASPALIDTGFESSGTAETANTLASSLKAFEGVTAQIGTNLQAQRGQTEGAAAGAAGNPTTKKGFLQGTAYSQAYNNAALRSYAVTAEADAEDNAARLEAEAGTDPEKFKATFGARRDETIKNAPPEARGILNDIYNRRLGAGVARLGAAQVEEYQKAGRGIVAEGVARSVDRIANWHASDDPAQHALADEEQLKMQMLVDGAVADGTLTRSEARAAQTGAQRAIVAQTVEARFSKELDNPYGDPVKFITRLKDYNKTSEALPPAEEAKLEDALWTALRERNARTAATHAADAAEEKARYEAGDREATSALLSGTLTQKQLLRMVDSSNLQPSVARTLLNELHTGEPGVDDPKVAFSTRVNLLNYSDQDIATMPGLTWKTRGDLILKKREEEQGWKGTQAAREAADRIDRALGIVPGTMVAALSPAQRTQRERALTDWYNTVDALPPEERQLAVIDSAETVVKKFIRNSNVEKAQKQRDNLEAYKTRAGDVSKMGKSQKAEYDAEIKRREAAIAAAEAEAMRQ